MRSLRSPPTISIILPVYNGAALLDRALESVLQQTFQQWEVVGVDDGSTDGSYAALQQWAARDGRVRAMRLEENSGASAARNVALRAAGGEFVTYLDCDDEYYPDYLAYVDHFRQKSDVLIFGYDLVRQSSQIPQPHPTGQATTSGQPVSAWEPARVRGNLFARNIVTPLGVAHRRDLWQKVGGFNELLWRDEDWDFCKRLARAGAEFAFLPLKSGRYHVRPGSLSRVPHLTRRQRETVTANWEAGRPIYDTLDLKSEISMNTNSRPTSIGPAGLFLMQTGRTP